MSKKKLRIGYYTTDGYTRPVPAITRAVEEAKLALENAGHTLIKFEVPRIADAMRILTAGKFEFVPLTRRLVVIKQLCKNVGTGNVIKICTRMPSLITMSVFASKNLIFITHILCSAV